MDIMCRERINIVSVRDRSNGLNIFRTKIFFSVYPDNLLETINNLMTELDTQCKNRRNSGVKITHFLKSNLTTLILFRKKISCRGDLESRQVDNTDRSSENNVINPIFTATMQKHLFLVSCSNWLCCTF